MKKLASTLLISFALAHTASAGKEVVQGQVGNFKISTELNDQGQGVKRCMADTQRKGETGLRFSLFADGKLFFSINGTGAPVGSKEVVEFNLRPHAGGLIRLPMTQRGNNRLWTEKPIDLQMVERSRRAKEMELSIVSTGKRDWFSFPEINAVLNRLEGCVREAEKTSVASAIPAQKTTVSVASKIAPHLCAEVKGGQFFPNTEIILSACNGQIAQKFQYDEKTKQAHLLANPELCVGIERTNQGFQYLSTKKCSEQAEKWSYVGRHSEIKSSDRLCWDVPNGNRDLQAFKEGQRLIAYKCHGLINQQFSVNP